MRFGEFISLRGAINKVERMILSLNNKTYELDDLQDKDYQNMVFLSKKEAKEKFNKIKRDARTLVEFSRNYLNVIEDAFENAEFEEKE